MRSAGATAVAEDLVVLHEAVTGAMRENRYDTTDVHTEVARRLRTSGADLRAGLGACVLYLPQSLTQAQVRVVQALAEAADLTVIAAMTGVKRADDAVERSLAMLRLAADPQPDRAIATRVINASDSDDKVRCVVREVIEKLRTTPAHRVAVLYAASSPYARLVHEQLAAAGVTTNGPGVRPADERAVARTLLEILALVDHDVPRGELFQALANAPVRDFAGTRVPVSRWERISRTAGVVAGADWDVRLGDYVTDLHDQAAVEQAGDDPQQWLVERLGREADAAQRMRAFADRLRGELHGAAALATWHELAAWCLRRHCCVVPCSRNR